MEIIRFYEQKLFLRKYVYWIMDLIRDGRFYDIPSSKKIKDFPKYGTVTKDTNLWNIRYLERLFHCSDDMYGHLDPDGTFHYEGAKLCGKRICPICTTKRAINDFSKLKFQMDNMQDEFCYYMLTLTLPNNKLGFKDELKIMKKVSRDLFRFIGYEGDGNKFNFCSGIFGSYEIKKSDKNNDWHPHLHVVLAYPKQYIIEQHVNEFHLGYKKRIYENGLVLRSGKKTLTLSADNVMEKYIQLIQKYTDIYNDRLNNKRFIDIGFHPCYGIEDSVNELTKYLFKFDSIKNADDLYVFLRDIHGFKQHVRRGVFKWTDELDEQYKQYLDQKYCDENLHFIQSGSKAVTVRFHKNTYIAFYDSPALLNVEFTNLKRECIVRNYFDLIVKPRGPDDPCDQIGKFKFLKRSIIDESEDFYEYDVSLDQLCLGV